MAKVKKHKKGAVFFEAALIFYFLQVYRRFLRHRNVRMRSGAVEGGARFSFCGVRGTFLKTWAAAALYAAVGKGAVGKKGAEAQERKIQK